MPKLITSSITILAMLLIDGCARIPGASSSDGGHESIDSKNYREIVFKIEDERNENEPNPKRAAIVAEEMESRLVASNINNYVINVRGEDEVVVALDLSKDLYNYTVKYLTFSGDNFALVSSNGKPESVRIPTRLFNPNNVRIEYKGDANNPVIVIPVTYEGKVDIQELVNQFDTSTDESNCYCDHIQQNLIYLWANFDDASGEGIDSLNSDPIAREKVLMAFNASNIWYEDSKEKETEIFYMCATAREENPNQLDISGLKDDNDRANYLVRLLKAKKYDYKLSCSAMNVSESGVDYYENAKVLDETLTRPA